MRHAYLEDADWDEFLERFPQAHLLQTAGWAEFKADFGWTSARVRSENACAQILFKALPLGLTIAYLPKGPVGANWNEIVPQIDTLCRARNAVFLQVEPDLFEPLPAVFLESSFAGFRQEEHTIQPRRTILIDLSPDEEQLLAAMKQKTRYNVRLAEKKGVRVSLSADLRGFYRMMQTTAKRDGFALHDFSYYQRVFQIFEPRGKCALLEASLDNQALAYLMVFVHRERAWYFYGASDDESRNLMPTYLLQWEAMRWAKAHGAAVYDLWGIPDEDEETLERDFPSRSDGLWGVYRFKRGFGGRVARSAPALIKVYRPLIYKAYQIYRAQKQAGLDAAS